MEAFLVLIQLCRLFIKWLVYAIFIDVQKTDSSAVLVPQNAKKITA